MQGEELKKIVTKAHEAISRLCDGESWRMCVPANPETDHDLILSAALRESSARIATLERELDRLREKLPKTADGTTMYPGMIVWVVVEKPYGFELSSCEVEYIETSGGARFVWRDDGDGKLENIGKCFDSREAAGVEALERREAYIAESLKHRKANHDD